MANAIKLLKMRFFSWMINFKAHALYIAFLQALLMK